MNTARKIRILLADDHRIMCDGLQLVLERHSDLEVVGVAGNGRQAVAMARELKPDVVVMDVAMPELNGIEATRQIVLENPDSKVVALSMYSDKRSVNGMLASGATGYLLKDGAAEELARAIRTVAANRVFLSAEVASLVVQEYKHHLGSDSEVEKTSLSPREQEVLQLLVEGNSPRLVADKLHIGVKTVESHRRRVMDKLDLHSVAELTKYAVREGITSLEQ